MMSALTSILDVAQEWKRLGNGLYLTAASLVSLLVVVAMAETATPGAIIHSLSEFMGWSMIASGTGDAAAPWLTTTSPVVANLSFAVMSGIFAWLAVVIGWCMQRESDNARRVRAHVAERGAETAATGAIESGLRRSMDE